MADSRLKTNTTEEQNNISLYFADAKKEKLLTREEEIELTKRLKEGDAEARSKLIRSNLRFVITIAKQYKNSGRLKRPHQKPAGFTAPSCPRRLCLPAFRSKTMRSSP